MRLLRRVNQNQLHRRSLNPLRRPPRIQRRLLFAVRASHPDALRKLITISPKLLAAAKGTTDSDNPTRLAAAGRSLKASNVEQILQQLVDDKRIDPRLIRALSRI